MKRQILNKKKNEFLTSVLSREWNIKIKNPCKELRMAKKYWNTMVLLSSAKIPKSHVMPSKGKRTATDLTPDLMMRN